MDNDPRYIRLEENLKFMMDVWTRLIERAKKNWKSINSFLKEFHVEFLPVQKRAYAPVSPPYKIRDWGGVQPRAPPKTFTPQPMRRRG